MSEEPTNKKKPTSTRASPTGPGQPGRGGRAGRKQTGSTRSNPKGTGDDTLPLLGVTDIVVSSIADTPAPPMRHRYIQVEKGNLLTYFNYGLIYPVNMEEREIVRTQTRAQDPQSKCPNGLLLASGFYTDAEEDQVLLDVALSPEEEKNLITVAGVDVLSAPLPISRIRAIWTLNEKAKKSILASAKTFSDAAVPSALVQQAPQNLIAACGLPDLSQVSIPPITQAARDQKADYDRMLGMLAFMRNADKYFSSKTRKYADLARDYLPTLAKANSALPIPPLAAEQQKAAEFFFGFLTGNTSDLFFRHLLTLIRNRSNFDRATVNTILAEQNAALPSTAVARVRRAFGELFDDGFKPCVKILNETTGLWQYTLLSVLYRFNKKESNDKVNVKNLFPDVVADPKRGEIALALLGLYYGYAALPKDEEIDNIEPAIARIVGRTHPIKFETKTQLDRITIETIYQLARTGESQDSLFPYLPQGTQQEESNEGATASANSIVDTSYRVLDTRVRVLAVSDEAEQLIQLIRDTYRQGRTPVYLGLYVARRAPSLVNEVHFRRGKETTLDIDLDGMLSLIRQVTPGETAEIRACIDLDRNYVYRLTVQ